MLDTRYGQPSSRTLSNEECDARIVQAIEGADAATAMGYARHQYSEILERYFVAVLDDFALGQSFVCPTIEATLATLADTQRGNRNIKVELLKQAKRRAAAEGVAPAAAKNGTSVGQAAETRRLLSELMPSTRELLVLRYVCELSTAELSEFFGVDQGSMMRRLSNALDDLISESDRRDNSAVQVVRQQELRDEWQCLVDGTATPELVRKVAEDDELRDALHRAKRLIARVSSATSDYVPLPSVAVTSGQATQKSEEPTVVVEQAAKEKHDANATRAVAAIEPLPKRMAWLLTGVALIVVALIVSFRFWRNSGEQVDLSNVASVIEVESISLDAADGKITICDSSSRPCRAAAVGEEIREGDSVRTDNFATMQFALGSSSRIVLGRGSALRLERSSSVPTLTSGTMSVEAFNSDSARALAEVGGFRIFGKRSRLSVRADASSFVVQVNRGNVRLARNGQRDTELYAGEQASLAQGRILSVSGAGDAVELSDRKYDSRMQIATDEPADGLGQLLAKKPGELKERGDAVHLKRHWVNVRVVGAVARTEIEEVFANDTDDVLEGIFRFPLPSGAQIERLALDVDGRLVDGAFVDREKAAAIWRGNIVNAAPQMKNQIKDDIVWVPGPWRDPALLEWQRGNRFELRIYPIPKHGQRRIVLAYTEVLPELLGKRRYTYALPAQSKQVRGIEEFRLNLELRGHDKKTMPVVLGYTATPVERGDVTQMSLEQRDFLPHGDLGVEFALPNQGQPLLAWAHQPAGSDDHAYAALLLRPRLPVATDDLPRSFAFAVDVSRSMYGENLRRATQVVAHMIEALSPDDRLTLLACHSECEIWSERQVTPDRGALARAVGWLEGLNAEGASDPTFAVETAARVAQEQGRRVQVVYVGDGTPTVGAVRPGAISSYLRRALETLPVQVTSIAVGSDSDIESLRALSSPSGGAVIPYVPGMKMPRVASRALASIWGRRLTGISVEVPKGMVLSELPEDGISSGDELLLVAKMDNSVARGDVVIRGRILEQPFEQRYPLELVAVRGERNAFVPRLYAASRISVLDRRADDAARNEAVSLSQLFSVASRHTSLLVLESQAMFKAFGLDNQRKAETWTGELESEGNRAQFEGSETSEDSSIESANGTVARPAESGSFSAKTSGAAPAPMRKAAPAMAEEYAAPPAGGSAASAPEVGRVFEMRDRHGCAPGDLGCAMRAAARNERGGEVRREPSAPPRRPRMIPMRRIWERRGEILPEATVPARAKPDRIAKAEAALSSAPDRRLLTKQLFDLHVAAGNFDHAERIAEQWNLRDPLDVEAIVARADMAARNGQRALAIRILGSVIDVRPSDVGAQQRLLRLHHWQKLDNVSCRFALALAAFRVKDLSANVEALRCSSVLLSEEPALAELRRELMLGMDASIRDLVEKKAVQPGAPDRIQGDLRMIATWVGDGCDLDVSMVDPDGHRISWLGAPSRSVISAIGVNQTNEEKLALRGGKPGEYVIEISRASDRCREKEPIRGNLEVFAVDAKRTIPFQFSGNTVRLGVIRVSSIPKLVPVSSVSWAGTGF